MMMASALGFGNGMITHGSEFLNVMNDELKLRQVTREPLLIELRLQKKRRQ